MAWRPSLGTWPDRGGIRARVWAPRAERVEFVPEVGGDPIRLERNDDGTFGGLLRGIGSGDRYRYRVDGRGPFPDPASRFQPEGVHGPSEVINPATFAWTDAGWG